MAIAAVCQPLAASPLKMLVDVGSVQAAQVPIVAREEDEAVEWDGGPT